MLGDAVKDYICKHGAAVDIVYNRMGNRGALKSRLKCENKGVYANMFKFTPNMESHGQK